MSDLNDLHKWIIVVHLHNTLANRLVIRAY